jgi:hypothetical protein
LVTDNPSDTTHQGQRNDHHRYYGWHPAQPDETLVRGYVGKGLTLALLLFHLVGSKLGLGLVDFGVLNTVVGFRMFVGRLGVGQRGQQRERKTKQNYLSDKHMVGCS